MPIFGKKLPSRMSDEELEARNQELMLEKEAVRDQQRAIVAEMDKRIELERQARLMAEADEETRESLLPSLDPDVRRRMEKYAPFTTEV